MGITCSPCHFLHLGTARARIRRTRLARELARTSLLHMARMMLRSYDSNLTDKVCNRFACPRLRTARARIRCTRLARELARTSLLHMARTMLRSYNSNPTDKVCNRFARPRLGTGDSGTHHRKRRLQFD